jgi:hypothetical protein
MSNLMQPRTYAIMLSAFAVSLFLGVAGMNLFLDPMGVFGTNLLPRPKNFNDRYVKFSQYQSRSGQYDGVVFGSSRLNAIPIAEVSRHTGGISYANFGVVGGMLSDHVTVLDFVLREKTARGQHIRSVFILLDADLFGRRPFTNESLQFVWPPALTGESPLRFWWRNLVAIQFQAWRSALGDIVKTGQSAEASVPGLPRESTDILSSMVGFAGIGIANAQPSIPAAPSPVAAPAREKVTKRPLYPQHLELWTNLVALCRAQGIELIVAISPLSRTMAAEFDLADLSKAIDDVAALAPVWDFSNAGWIADDPKLWLDSSHFAPEVGRMMAARMFGDPTTPQWAAFGRLRQQRDMASSAK